MRPTIKIGTTMNENTNNSENTENTDSHNLPLTIVTVVAAGALGYVAAKKVMRRIHRPVNRTVATSPIYVITTLA